MNCWNRIIQSYLSIFFQLFPTDNGKELNPVRGGNRNLFGRVGHIPPQGGQPTVISIVRNIEYIIINCERSEVSDSERAEQALPD